MIGLDEVGRGSLAGPLLVVAARQIADLPDGLADSKILSRQQREEFLPFLIQVCQFGEGWVGPKEIDRHGLSKALKLGLKRAFRQLRAQTDEHIILDGNFNYLSKAYKRVECVIDADALLPLVSAASIYAKVKRDRFMYQLALRHKRYGFETNVGYGTAFHYSALRKHGPLLKIHRLSYAPLKAI